MEHTQLDQFLREGIAAARAGQREQARDLLLRVIAVDEEVETAWLWLSGVVDDLQDRRICLENVLTLNPNNAAAQQGLRWLDEHGPAPVAQPAASQPPAAREAALSEPSPVLAPTRRPPPTTIEIDPYGCPYCGGSVSGEEPVCDHCRRSVALRYRKRDDWTAVGWLVLFFALLGLVAWLEGYSVAQFVQVGQLPQWLGGTTIRYLVGAALFQPEGFPGELIEFAGVVTLVNYLFAGLCLVAAGGLAFRSRWAYFGALVLLGLLVVITGVGLLARLTGWIPALFRLGLVALCGKWLIDSAPAFEWETRLYDADVDHHLKTDMDYYVQGQHYRELGMWAKAAAHWQIATRLAPSRAEYRAVLANAYARMGYPAAALAEANKALALTPDDEQLRALCDHLAAIVPGEPA